MIIEMNNSLSTNITNTHKQIVSILSSLLVSMLLFKDFIISGNESMFKVEEEKNNNSAEENEVGGLFRVVSKTQEKKQQQRDTMNAPDVSKFPTTHIRDWSSKEVRFVF